MSERDLSKALNTALEMSRTIPSTSASAPMNREGLTIDQRLIRASLNDVSWIIINFMATNVFIKMTCQLKINLLGHALPG